MTPVAADGGDTRWGSAPISEIDILWMTAGLGCDGDTIAVTAATQPSLEDLILGAFPWIPKVKFHNPFLAYENGDEFVRYFRDAAEGKLSPFILVVEGSIPNEKNKQEGYWASFGTDAEDRAAHHHLRLDRPVGAQGMGCGGSGDLCDLWWHSCDAGKPHRVHGLGGLSGLGLEVGCGHSHCVRSGMPGTTRQLHRGPAVFAEYGGRSRPDDPSGRCLAPDLAIWFNGARGMRPRRILRAGAVRGRVWIADVHREARMLGAGGAVQCWESADGWEESADVRMWAAFVLVVLCRVFRTSSCPS